MKNDVIKKDVSKYNIVITNFEGPLDLLVYLISKNKMNIFDISLSELTDKYIEYLNAMSEKNLEITSEFILMASTLLDIKSRKLLPKLEIQEDEDEQLTEEEMIRKIVEYKKYKEIAQRIKSMYDNNYGSISKNPEKIKNNFKNKTIYKNINYNKLYKVYVELIQKNKNKINKKANDVRKIALYDKFTVKDKVNQILSYLDENDNMIFNKMYDVSKCSNVEVITAFLGILELTRLKQVNIGQKYLFSDIYVNRAENFDLQSSNSINDETYKNKF